MNSIEELANSEILQVATLKNSIFETTLLVTARVLWWSYFFFNCEYLPYEICHSLLQQSNYGPLKNLGDSLRKNPENRLTGQYYNQEKLLDKVFGRLALITVSTKSFFFFFTIK